MKLLLAIVLSFALFGCASPYEAPKTGPIATLIVPSPERNFGMTYSSSRSIQIARINNKGCTDDEMFISEEDLGPESEIYVPANVPLGISVHQRRGTAKCGINVAVELRENEVYEVDFSSAFSFCGMDIYNLRDGERQEKVPSKKLHVAATALCLED